MSGFLCMNTLHTIGFLLWILSYAYTPLYLRVAYMTLVMILFLAT